VRLIVCWNTARGPLGHPCGDAFHALTDAGHQPDVVKARGLRLLPDVLNRSAGRREAKRLTGRSVVPVLITDDGEVIPESKAIVAWAAAHPARAASDA
jgi:hypothetical protein